MILQVFSDIHHDISKKNIDINPKADLIVSLGDNCTYKEIEYLYKDIKKTIIIIPGNHEYYNGDLLEIKEYWEHINHKHKHIHILDDNCYIQGNYRFVGTTLWSGFSLYGERNRGRIMQEASKRVRDFKNITYGKKTFSPIDMFNLHRKSLTWLSSVEPFDGTNILLTHFPVSKNSIHPKYRGEILSGYYSNDLDYILSEYQYHFHGHIHHPFKYTVGKTSVFSSPRGYPMTDHQFENKNFNNGLIIHI